MPSYLRVPTSRTGSRPVDRQVKLWSEDVRRPPDVLLRHTHLNGIAGMSWFIIHVYEELHAWKELRGKPKSKPWALALEINYESSDSKNMGAEFGLVTRKWGGEQCRYHQQSQHKQNMCCSSTRKASPAHMMLSERARECHPCGGLWVTAGPWEKHQALSGHKPCPLSGRVECSEPRPTVITAATTQVFFFLAKVEW